MYENVPYKLYPGKELPHPVYIYGKTQCEHCLHAREQLSTAGLAYHYVALDMIAHAVRIEVVRDLKARSNNQLFLPVLEYGAEFLFGFNADVWRQTLQIA